MLPSLTNRDYCSCCGDLEEEKRGFLIRTDKRQTAYHECFICRDCFLESFIKLIKKDLRTKKK